MLCTGLILRTAYLQHRKVHKYNPFVQYIFFATRWLLSSPQCKPQGFISVEPITRFILRGHPKGTVYFWRANHKGLAWGATQRQVYSVELTKRVISAGLTKRLGLIIKRNISLPGRRDLCFAKLCNIFAVTKSGRIFAAGYLLLRFYPKKTRSVPLQLFQMLARY